VFRWVNLLPLPQKEDIARISIAKTIQVESRNNSVSRASFLNPFIGDLSHDLIQDIHKCQYFEITGHEEKDIELNAILQSYCDYAIRNWSILENGSYK